ncbi:hypothetical protein, partial [Vibrio harveyi]
MKNLNLSIIAVSTAVFLSGCSTPPPQATFVPPTATIEGDYSKAVDCATNVISMPAVGQFFQYEDAEKERFIVNYNSSVVYKPSFITLNLKMKANLR